MMIGAIFWVDMILTGFFEGGLGGLLKIVTIETSSAGTAGTIIFSNNISLLSIRLWILDFSKGQPKGEIAHRRQSSPHPGNKPASNKFL